MNFNHHITERFGIVMVGWPLSGGLKCPGDINSRVELNLVITAFENGTARFERITLEELNARFAAEEEERHCQGELAPTTISSPPATPSTTNDASAGASPSGSPASTPPSLPVGLTAALAPHASSNVATMSTFSVVGEGGPSQKKSRKVRSDKGVKRGPRGCNNAPVPAADASVPPCA